MFIKYFLLSTVLTLSIPAFSAPVKTFNLKYSCVNKSATSEQKNLELVISISTYPNSKKITWATIETRRDIFDLNLVKNDSRTLETDAFSAEVGGVDLDASYQLKLSQPVNEQLSSFDASWKLLVNDQPINLAEGVSNPEKFSCTVASAKSSTVTAALKNAAEVYLKSLGDDWNVEGDKMSGYDFIRGYLGKVKRSMERTGEYSIEGHRVNLKVDGVDVLVFVVNASEEESGSLTVYTNKGEFLTDIQN